MMRSLCANILKTSMARHVRFASSEVPTIEKSLNQVTLLGRVGADPQTRGSEAHPVVLFSLATNTTLRGEDDLRQRTEWHRVSVFKPYLRQSALNYIRKGSRVMIMGKIMYGETKDAKGVTHPSMTVVADDIVFVGHSREASEEASVSL